MTDPIHTAALALANARRQHTTADPAALAPLVETLQGAYAVQDRVAQELGWFDTGVPRFWKSGGAAREQPLTHAPLPPSGVWPSAASARDGHLQLRLVEAEIALRLGRDVTPAEAERLSCDDDASGLVDAMAVSIELVDSRWRDLQQATPLLKLADQQSHGALVIGEWVPFAPRAWEGQSCRVQIGAAPPRGFVGTHSLGDPAWLLPQWLRHVTARYGRAVPRGTVVTTGTWCGLLPAGVGDRVHVAFDGVGEAEVRY